MPVACFQLVCVCVCVWKTNNNYHLFLSHSLNLSHSHAHSLHLSLTHTHTHTHYLSFPGRWHRDPVLHHHRLEEVHRIQFSGGGEQQARPGSVHQRRERPDPVWWWAERPHQDWACNAKSFILVFVNTEPSFTWLVLVYLLRHTQTLRTLVHSRLCQCEPFDETWRLFCSLCFPSSQCSASESHSGGPELKGKGPAYMGGLGSSLKDIQFVTFNVSSCHFTKTFATRRGQVSGVWCYLV